MKIAFFTESYLPDPNGIATTVAGTVEELQKMGHTVYVIAPSHPGYTDKKNVIRLYSMKIYEKLDMRTALHLPERNIIKILRLNVDIIHGHGGGSVSLLGWEVARLKNAPYIGTYHTFAHQYTHYFLRGKVLTPAIVKTITRVFGNMSEQLIAPTIRAKKELRKLGVKSPITVLPSGIDRSHFQSQGKGYLRDMLKIPKTTKIILYVGRLGKEKSVDFLLSSLQDVLRNHPNTVLVLVGDGPEKQALKKQAVKLKIDNQVYFPGFVKGAYIPQVYADGNIFVFASKTETQGMVLIEAMTSGIPVVAVKDKAFNDILTDGYNSFVTKRTEKDFRTHVETLLASSTLRDEMAKNAMESTIKYSITARTQELVGIYTSLIEEHKARGTSPFRKTFRGVKKIVRLLST